MTLGIKVLDKVIELAKTSTKKYRDELSKNIHVADISYNILKASVPSLSNEEYTQILDAFNNAANHRSKSLQHSIRSIKDSSWNGLVYVSDQKYGSFLIAESANALQIRTSKIIKSLQESVPKLSSLGNNTSLISFEQVSTSTPILTKLNEIYKRIPLAAGNMMMTKALEQGSTHTFDTAYKFENLSINSSDKSLSTVLGINTVLVAIQSDARKNSLEKIETSITKQVINFLTSNEFVSGMMASPEGICMIAEIEYSIAKILNPKLKKPPKPISKTTRGKPAKVKDLSTTVPFAPPRLRDISTGKFKSLAELHRLLNLHLHDVVSANMGDGNRRDILNYRTGRFATSTKVDRVTQSRDGMITAFYSYMNNPYGTFSTGGQQQNPRSRDPKLLIARSIRDIASQYVSNRMRSVNV